MSETIVVPDQSGNNQNGWNSPLPYLAMNGGGLGFGGGWGTGILGFLLGAMFNGGFGGNGYGQRDGYGMRDGGSYGNRYDDPYIGERRGRRY